MGLKQQQLTFRNVQTELLSSQSLLSLLMDDVGVFEQETVWSSSLQRSAPPQTL